MSFKSGVTVREFIDDYIGVHPYYSGTFTVSASLSATKYRPYEYKKLYDVVYYDGKLKGEPFPELVLDWKVSETTEVASELIFERIELKSVIISVAIDISAMLERAGVVVCDSDPFDMDRHLRCTNMDAPLTEEEKRTVEEYFALRRHKYGGMRVVFDD